MGMIQGKDKAGKTTSYYAPKLVFINPSTGNWQFVSTDPDKFVAENYPFRNEAFPELTDQELITHEDEKTSIKKLQSSGCKYLVLYFAHNEYSKTHIGPLKSWYNENYEKCQGTSKQFQVVFLSLDDETTFEAHYHLHGEWPALPPSNGLAKRILIRYGAFAIVEVETGCRVGTVQLQPFQPDKPKPMQPAFEPGHLVTDYNAKWLSNAKFLSFSPNAKDADIARQAIAPVAAKYKHVIDQPIEFQVVSGLGYANELCEEFGLHEGFRGSVIVTTGLRQGQRYYAEVYRYSSLSDRGSISTSRVESFVEKYLDDWSGSGREKLEKVARG